MSLTEIKKVLYKENPKAKFQFIRKGIAYYRAATYALGIINFEVPVSDMGDADFHLEMDGKLLNRWIVNVDKPIEANNKLEINYERYEELLEIMEEDDEEFRNGPFYDELLDLQKSIIELKKPKFLKVINSGKMEHKYQNVYVNLVSPILNNYADGWDRYHIIDLSDILDDFGFDSLPDLKSAKIMYKIFIGDISDDDFEEEYEDFEGDGDYDLSDIINMMDEVIKLDISRFQKDW